MLPWLETLSPTEEVPSAASPELRAWAMGRIGADATAWAAQVTRTVTARLARESNWLAPAEAKRGCEECLLTTLVGLHDALDGSDIRTPDGALDDARVAARAGTPLERLMRTVWACHTAVQETLLGVIGAVVDPADLLEEVLRLNTALAAYLDRYISDISLTFDRERLESESRFLAERRRTVDALLAGDDVPEAAVRRLGIQLADYHLAACGWPSGGNRAFDTDNSAFRFAEQVAGRFRASGWLIIERIDHVEFHWSLPGRFDPSAEELTQQRPTRMCLAFGPVGAGLEGFKAATAGARRARSVGLQMPSPVCLRYDDVSLLALLIADGEHARSFVARELAGLLGTDAMSASIRETLRWFLVTGRSRQAAAKESHVATTTVAYRVKRAEELLGRPAFTRPHETMAALDLVEAFPHLLKPRDQAG